MGKKTKRRDESDIPKESQFKKFVKKRAPIYLAGIAIVIIFLVPELTKNDLQSSLPQDLSQEEIQVIDTLMAYKGPNEIGLSMMKAISNKISEEYGDEKIYNNKKTNIDLTISKIDNIENNYDVVFTFTSHKGELNYEWNVDIESGKVVGNNPESKHLVDLVDFYD